MRALLSAILLSGLASGCALHQTHEMRTGTLHQPMPDWQSGLVRGQSDVGEPLVATGPAGYPGQAVSHGRRSAVSGPGGYHPGGPRIAGPSPGVTRSAGGRVQIEFNDTDIAEAAKAILGDVMRVSYSIDPRVTGRISLKTRGPATPEEALAIFETALDQNKAAIVQTDGVFTVVPLANGTVEGAAPIVPGGSGPEAPGGFTVRAIELRHIAAGEMADILKPTAKAGIVRIDAARNVIVLSGTGAQHRAWAETVRTFDVDWLANRSVGVFKVDGMPAQTMIASLTEVMRNENVDASLARFIVIDSNNSILAVAKTRDVLASIRRWVQRLEQATGSRPKLHTYEMRYAQAKDAAKIVGRVLGIQVAASEAELTGAGPNGSPVGTTAGLGRSPGPAPGPLGAAPPAAPAAIPPTVQSAQFALPGSAVQLGAPRGEAAGLPPGAVPAVSPTIRIVPNEQTNTLLVYGTEADFQRVLTVLRSIDNPQRQVLVEAAIIEVTLNDTLRHGVQWEIENIIGKQVVGVALRNGDIGIGPETPGFAVSVGTPIKAIVDAIGEVTSINVISSPNLMVTNNQSARLAVGDQVPITTSSRTSNLTADSTTVNTIEFRDTGIIFDVTPRINSANSVTLNIAQEVSAVQRSAQPTLTPTISQRRLNSAVTVEHGETIVLGGLFSNESTRGRAGVPGLSAVPGLGNLFGRTEQVGRKTELLVLISPKIVNDAYDSRAVTREISRRMTELQLEEQALAAIVCTPPTPCGQTIESTPLPPPPSAPGPTAWPAATVETAPVPARPARPSLRSSMK